MTWPVMFRFGYGKYGPVAQDAGWLAFSTLAATLYCRYL